MKAVKSVILTLGVLVFISSCIKENELPVDNNEGFGQELTFFATRESSDTRSVLQDGDKVFWSPNDSITLFVVDSRNRSYKRYTFRSTNEEPAASATFKGVVDELPDSPVFYAIHPASKTSTLPYSGDRNGDFVLDVPSFQYVGDDRFDSFMTVATSDSYDLSFRHVMSGFSFSVTRDDIKSIQVDCDRGENFPLSGFFYVDLSDLDGMEGIFGAGWQGFYGGNGISTTVLPSQGEYFVPGKTYYVALPKRYLPSLRLIYRTDTEYAIYKHSGYLECTRGKVYSIGSRDGDLTFYPDETIERAQITKVSDYLTGDVRRVEFITESDLVTDCIVPSNYYPVYAEVAGTTVKFHTKAPAFSTTLVEGLFTGIQNTVEYIDMGVFDFIDGGMSFMNLKQLKQVDLSEVRTKTVTDMSGCFMGCESLESVDLSSLDTRNVYYIAGMFSECKSLTEIDLSALDLSSAKDMMLMFEKCDKLEEVRFNPNVTITPTRTGWMFYDCFNLAKVDVSSFDMSKSTNISQMFGNCFSMRDLTLGEFDFGEFTDNKVQLFMYMASKSKACKITCGEEVMERLRSQEGQATTFLRLKYITWYRTGEATPAYCPPDFSGLYESTDYSQNGQLKVIQSASVGNGINIMIVGDYYSDRLIADGTYDNDMRAVAEAIFTEEPFKTFRNMFNVYQVNVVSPHEDVSGIGALETSSGGGMLSGNQKLTLLYFPDQLKDDKLYQSVVIVLTNTNLEGGTVDWGFGPNGASDTASGDYGSGISMMYITKQNSDERFRETIHHEFGHAFPKLADEYWYPDENQSLVETWDIEAIEHLQSLGYLKNISVTNDPAKVPWSKFLSIDRYVSAGLGIYEGGYRYSYGVWRPTEDSIMRFNTGGYNAPSREAIYYRIHKLAYGDEWEYSFEDFLEYDMINFQ